MREIALLLLLLTPDWSFLHDFRDGLDTYLTPHKQLAEEVSPVNLALVGPLKLDNARYSGDEKAIYTTEVTTQTELISNHADDKFQIASLTKLMTVYVGLKSGRNLDSVVTIPHYTLREGDAVAGFGVGESMKYRDLLAGVLINSGSDAAQAVAIIDSKTIDAFVIKMNQAAKDLELTNTHYSNAVGWDDAQNYSSARDISTLSQILLTNTFFHETVAKKAEVVTTATGRQINLITTNQLLGVNGFTGVKTGYTFGAGECLVSQEKHNGKEILTVVLGSTNRFGETVAANTWTKQHFLW